MQKLPLLYVLHSGQLYGTERMALWTAHGLRESCDTTLLAPFGPVHDEAARFGITTVPFAGTKDLLFKLRPHFAQHARLAVFATGVTHSLAATAWNALFRRNLVHIHMVHGGTDETLSYGRKRWLNRTGVKFVAVSEYVRERLIAHGVRANSIHVVENFLPAAQVANCPRREPFSGEPVQRITIVSRIDPIKRVDLLLDALDRSPSLRTLRFRVLGTGWDLDALRARAADAHPNVTFEGFNADVPSALAASDLLLHLCPEEPFGLAILEAMAAHLPVLVPDQGGAATLVANGQTGFTFTANDPNHLAETLLKLHSMNADTLNKVVRAGYATLTHRFSPEARLPDYVELLSKELSWQAEPTRHACPSSSSDEMRAID